MFPIKETNDLQGAALYGIWSNGAQRVNPSQKRCCQAHKQGVEKRGFQPPPQLKSLPPSLQAIIFWFGINASQEIIEYFFVARCIGYQMQ